MRKNPWKKKSLKMKGNTLEEIQKNIEEQFMLSLEKGEAISCYLYFPFEFLSENVRKHLDDFLSEEAYKNLEKGLLQPDSFVVYSDDTANVKMDTRETQLETLSRMLDYFTAKEEYEKCSRIKELTNTYIDGQS